MEPAIELDVAVIAGVRVERQQPPLLATLGRFAGVFRVWFDSGPMVRRTVMIRSVVWGSLVLIGLAVVIKSAVLPKVRPRASAHQEAEDGRA